MQTKKRESHLLSPALYNQNEQIGRIRLIHGLLSSEFFSAFTTGALPGCNLKTRANCPGQSDANRRWCGSVFSTSLHAAGLSVAVSGWAGSASSSSSSGAASVTAMSRSTSS